MEVLKESHDLCDVEKNLMIQYQALISDVLGKAWINFADARLRVIVLTDGSQATSHGPTSTSER